MLPSDYETTYYPVFRLPPTDQEQAKMAAKFASKNGATAIWVVEDVVTNSVYSTYLAGEFVKQVQELKTSKVLLWTTNREHPSADAVKALEINWVFFAGSWSNGLILTRQVKEMRKKRVIPILLSNACADSELLRYGGDDMKGVYLVNQMLASDFNDMGYAFWGTLASQLAIKLIHGAKNDFNVLASEKNWLWYNARYIAGVHRVADARDALREFMEQAALKKHTAFALGGQDLAGRHHLREQQYTFNSAGKAIERSFHVWQVQPVGNELQFKDIDFEM